MKKFTAVLALISLMITVFSFSAFADRPIDPDRASSLTVQYRYGDEYFEGLSIQIYRIADVSENGTYTLAGDFKNYPVPINGITSQTEWRRIVSTLSAYAAADKLVPTAEIVTDANGTVKLEDILPGMYMILSVKAEESSRVTVFESFLTVVPYPDENGEPKYDVTAYPKCEQYTPTPETIEYKVVKQWKDNSLTALRPEKITVDILKDGVLQSTQYLTPENNWSYSWQAPRDGSKWQAVERDIPEYYTVTVEEYDTTIIITNVYEDTDKPPVTGDTAMPRIYILIASISGCVLLLFAAWRKKSNI